MICKYCNKKNRKDARFCAGCGNSLTEEEVVYQNNNNVQNDSKAFAIVSIVIGCVSIFFGLFMLTLIPIAGLVFGIIQKGKSTERTIGIVVNSVAIGLSIIVWIFFGIFFGVVFKSILSEDGVANNIIDRIIEENYEYYGDFDSDKWNSYKSKVETPVFGTGINGEWANLDKDNKVLVINDEEMYLYEDGNNREDNYVYATYKMINLNESPINQKKKDATISKDDSAKLYFIVISPLKEVIDNEEKNINEENSGALMMIINHEDGQELQVIRGQILQGEEETDIDYYARIK